MKEKENLSDHHHREAVMPFASFASRLFDALHYDDDDGAILWKVAALHHQGKIPEVCILEAIDGCAAKEHDIGNMPGYFLECLRERCWRKKIEPDLDVHLEQLRKPKGLKHWPTTRAFSSVVSFAGITVDIPDMGENCPSAGTAPERPDPDEPLF